MHTVVPKVLHSSTAALRCVPPRRGRLQNPWMSKKKVLQATYLVLSPPPSLPRTPSLPSSPPLQIYSQLKECFWFEVRTSPFPRVLPRTSSNPSADQPTSLENATTTTQFMIERNSREVDPSGQGCKVSATVVIIGQGRREPKMHGDALFGHDLLFILILV